MFTALEPYDRQRLLRSVCAFAGELDLMDLFEQLLA
jgi:hypothetical protein